MFEQLPTKGTIFTDTLTGRNKYLDVSRYAQVFTNDSFFADTYPMEKKSIEGQGIREFIASFGVMDRIVCDGSKE